MADEVKIQDIIKKEKKEKKKKEPTKASLLQRTLAFLIDVFIITFVASFVSTFFIDAEKLSKLEDQEFSIIENYRDHKIDEKEYFTEYSNVYYKIARESGVLSIVTIFLEVGYFVVLQVHLGGQTFGKKLLKIRVESDQDSLSYDQMIFRSFISNLILLHIIQFILMLFCPKDIFIYLSVIFEVIQYIILFISAIMVMRSESGKAIHDRIAHTRVMKVV